MRCNLNSQNPYLSKIWRASVAYPFSCHFSSQIYIDTSPCPSFQLMRVKPQHPIISEESNFSRINMMFVLSVKRDDNHPFWFNIFNGRYSLVYARICGAFLQSRSFDKSTSSICLSLTCLPSNIILPLLLNYLPNYPLIFFYIFLRLSSNNAIHIS